MRSHSYDVTTAWTGNTGSGTSGYRDYTRSLEVTAAGRVTLPGSADPAFRGDPTRWNPELLLLAALSQCHLLSYLHVCVEAGVVVTAYHDQASGTMVEDGAGGGRFAEVMLRPHVGVTDRTMVGPATALHAEASARCFIAASVGFPVRHEPLVVSGDLGPASPDHHTGAGVAPGLARARAEIDRIDARLVQLLARRQQQVRYTARHTRDETAGRSPDDQAQVLAAARTRAEAAGLDVDVADRVWRALLAGSADHEPRTRADRPC